MKALFDTCIYVEWIRRGKHAELLLDSQTHKYLASAVLMELWAGARTKQAARVVERLLAPYQKAQRIVHPNVSHFIETGQILSDLPVRHRGRVRQAGFVNDILIALSARSIGATLYTTNSSDFRLIASHIRGLRAEYV